VSGGDTKDVTITGRKTVRSMTREDADRANTDTPVEVIPQGDWLLVRTNQDRGSRNERITDDLEIVLPRGFSVETRGCNGDYEAKRYRWHLEVNCSAAAWRIARIGGNVRMDIGRGDLIRVTDVKGRIDVQGGRGQQFGDGECWRGQVTIGGTFTGRWISRTWPSRCSSPGHAGRN